MKDFKNKKRFGGGSSRGGFGGGRPPFKSGGFGGGRGAGTTMHKAECSKCHKECEVPFKPNGKKPVYCKDCFTPESGGDSRDFQRGGDRRDDRREFGGRDNFRKNSYERPAYEKSTYDKPYAPSAREDRSGADVTKQLESLGRKMDTLIELMKESKKPAFLQEINAAKAASPKKQKAVKKAAKKSVAKRKK